MDKHSSLRRSPRFPISTKGSLVYTDKQGVTCSVRIKVTGISRQGISLESDTEVSARTYVNFRIEEPALSGSASVRYCARKKMRYSIGLEFSGGLEWSARETDSTTES